MDQIKSAWRENARDGMLVLAFLGSLLLYAANVMAGNSAAVSAVGEIREQLKGLVTVGAADQLKEQIKGLASQVGQLQTELRSAPRADQLIVLSNQIAEMRGSYSAIEGRLRDTENHVSTLQAEQNSITRASNATLGKR